MREIEFRGKHKDNGKWVYGDLLQNIDNGIGEEYGFVIAQPFKWPAKVIPETVGQYTGLKDKNGVRCYDLNCMERLVLCSDGIREPATGCKKP